MMIVLLTDVQKISQIPLILQIKKMVLIVDQKVSQMGTLLVLMKLSLMTDQKVL